MRNITTFDFNELNRFHKIFVLVSGGIDSSYLYEMIKSLFPDKTIPVNCWNPFEQSETLTQIAHDPKFLCIKPLKKIDYVKILHHAFLQIPKAINMRKNGNYQKKVFGCCSIIKHKAFLQSKIFVEPNTVVVSGIKYSDGRQRQLWLKSLQKGISYSKNTQPKQGFYHLHKKGQNYVYPFRDFKAKEFPSDVMDELRAKYPHLTHSGCKICPVLVVFQDKIKNEPRMNASLKYYAKICNNQ